MRGFVCKGELGRGAGGMGYLVAHSIFLKIILCAARYRDSLGTPGAPRAVGWGRGEAPRTGGCAKPPGVVVTPCAAWGYDGATERSRHTLFSARSRARPPPAPRPPGARGAWRSPGGRGGRRQNRPVETLQRGAPRLSFALSPRPRGRREWAAEAARRVRRPFSPSAAPRPDAQANGRTRIDAKGYPGREASPPIRRERPPVPRRETDAAPRPGTTDGDASGACWC